MWRMMKKMTKCSRSSVMLDGEISKCVDILQESCTGMHAIHHPIHSKVYINDMIVAVEAAKQGVTVGEGKVSGLMFADISWEYQKHPKDCRNK